MAVSCKRCDQVGNHFMDECLIQQLAELRVERDALKDAIIDMGDDKKSLRAERDALKAKNQDRAILLNVEVRARVDAESRCRELEGANLEVRRIYADCEDRRGEWSRKCRELEEVVEFYADPDTYFAVGFFPDPPNGDFMDDFSETEELGMKPGKRARAALKDTQTKDTPTKGEVDEKTNAVDNDDEPTGLRHNLVRGAPAARG